MSQFAEMIQSLHEESNGFEKLRQRLSDELIDEACKKSDVSNKRHRRLPNVSVVWLVVGMAIFRRESIQQVAKTFKIFGDRPPSSGSISDARKRLGPDAPRWLFRKLGLFWCEDSAAENWNGLTTFGIDGSVVTLEDSKENVAHFGKAGSRPDKSSAARPQARAVGLIELSSKLLVDAEVVPLSTGENTALKPILDRIPGNSITILDRGFQSKWNFHRLHLEKDNRHFLCRVRSNFKPRWVETLSPCSWLGEIEFKAAERENDPGLPSSKLIQIIEYKISGHKDIIRIATSLLDHIEFSDIKVADLYNLRWEFELGLRDLKVTLLDSKDNIRSKKPEGVRQELWAIFLAYNLVRFELSAVAAQHGVPARCLSFKTALISVSGFFQVFSSGFADMDSVPQAVKSMRDWIWQKRLAERKPERVCRRWLKNKQPSQFPKKHSDPAGY